MNAVTVPDRRELALRHLPLTGRGLEIGPSYNPLVPKSEGYRVETVDHADRETLKAKYTALGLPPELISRIEDVDHLWTGGPISAAVPDGTRYDYVVASHCLEHSVDLVGFLNDCEKLLAPGGRLALVLPDKRFCFDHFQPLSTLGDAVDAFHADNAFHTPGTLLDHQAYACTRGGQLIWSDASRDSYAMQFPNLEQGREVVAAGLAQDTYHDIHRWKFTPSSFRLLLTDLHHLGYHAMGLLDSHPTVGFEFFVTLEPNGSWPRVDRAAALLEIERELADANDHIESASAQPELDVLRQRSLDLQTALDELHASNSWRLTAPLRRASTAIRSLRRR